MEELSAIEYMMKLPVTELALRLELWANGLDGTDAHWHDAAILRAAAKRLRSGT